MLVTGFTNNFTSGEICDDAWDRTDIQPIAKGCAQATNYVIRVAGPLAKRRGMWRNGTLADQTKPGRLIPFRHSIDDALMLEFGDDTVRVWQTNGAPLLNAGVQVQFASPYAIGDLPGLRFKQVGDVIYIRHAAGLPPRTLVRTSNTVWTFALQVFPNGPWRPENINQGFTITVTGTDEADASAETTNAGSILVGEAIALTASQALFDPAMVGGYFRLRQTIGSASVASWQPGYRPLVGVYNLSNGRVYVASSQGHTDRNATNPPVQIAGSQSDGSNIWDYRHDGAGVVKITGYTDATHVDGVVIATVPLKSGQSTPYWSEGAYSAYRGWPRLWPAIREERLVEGATAANPDFIDLSETAGFDTINENFTPGLGTGLVVSTDAVRRRLGDDGAQILWSQISTYLLCGTASGEYLIAGSVLDEPISPSTVVVKTLSGFGSEDVYPAKAHKGLLYVTRGGQTLRELVVDTQQNPSTDDVTVLATHIGQRGLKQLAWISQPDNVLWVRLGDGGLATLTYHQEQNVRGWTGVQLGGGFTVEDIAVLPGPGRQETLWLIVHRIKGGAHQRQIWMQSQASDKLFLDGALLYTGAPVTAIAGLDDLDGDSVRILADGAQLKDRVIAGGATALGGSYSTIQAGLPYVATFQSLKLDLQAASLNQRQRITGCTVSLTGQAKIGLMGQPAETISPRQPADVPAALARRTIKNVTIAGDTVRDPRLVVTDDSAYDGVLYSLKPQVSVGA